MNNFVKTLSLNLKTSVDTPSFNKAKQSFDEFKKSNESIKVNFNFNEEQLKTIKQQIKSEFDSTEMSKLQIFDTEEERQNAEKVFKDYQETIAKIEILKKAVAEIQMFDKDNKHLEEMTEELKKLKKHKNDIDHENDNDDDDHNVAESETFRKGWKEAKTAWADQHTAASLGSQAFNKMVNSIETFKDNALKTFKKFVTDALEELEKIASWNINESTIYNKDASEMYMNYGLQGADAYAMNKALEATGIDNIETYLTDPLVRGNQALLDNFNEQYELAKSQYQRDLEIAKEYQNFQKEFAIFKQELQKSLIDFFMDNKDTIMDIMKFLMQSMELVVDLVGDIVSFFGGDTVKNRSNEQRQSDMNELLGVTNNSAISYDNRTTKVTMNNTYNGVGKVDQAALQNVGQMTYQQIIEYFGRQ